MAAKPGLTAFKMAIDNGFDYIPNAAFAPDTYKPKALKKKQQEQDQPKSSEDRKDDRTDKRRGRRNSDPGNRAAAAAGGTAAAQGYQQDHRSQYDGLGDDKRRSQRHSRDDSDQSYHGAQQPDSQGYPQQGYQPPPQQYQSYQAYTQAPTAEPQLSQQGDPNFPYVNHQQTLQGQQPLNPQSPPYNTTYNPYTSTQRFQQPTMGDAYFPPPPTGNNYHRYDPSNYQPAQGYQPSSSGGRYDERYAPARYDGRHGRPSREDEYSDDDYDRRHDDRRRDRSKRRHKKRDESEDEPGNPVLKSVDKRFSKTEKGLQTGAIGAIAGGLAGNRFGKGPLATIAGVVIGGLGANAWEKHDTRDKSKSRDSRRDKDKDRKSRRSKSEGRGRHSDEYDEDRREYESGRSGRGRDYDDYDSDGSEDSHERRKRERHERDKGGRKERSSRRDRDAEGPDDQFNWGKTISG